jgi:GT2 family glycosyltransferase
VIVVILNWHNLADTLECAQSVLRSDYPRLAVWVIDNSSDEDPSHCLGEHCPTARVIRPANKHSKPTLAGRLADVIMVERPQPVRRISPLAMPQRRIKARS